MPLRYFATSPCHAFGSTSCVRLRVSLGQKRKLGGTRERWRSMDSAREQFFRGAYDWSIAASFSACSLYLPSHRGVSKDQELRLDGAERQRSVKCLQSKIGPITLEVSTLV